VTSNGYNDSADSADARYAMKEALNAQRTEDYRNGRYTRAGGVVDPLPDNAPLFVKQYYDYYKTPRGSHPRSGNSTNGWNVTSSLPFINFLLLSRADEIRNAVMIVHGEVITFGIYGFYSIPSCAHRFWRADSQLFGKSPSRLLLARCRCQRELLRLSLLTV
jgi:hypothetical protein